MNSDTQNIIDSAWVAESEDRLNAYRTGKLTARPFDDVMKDLNAQTS